MNSQSVREVSNFCWLSGWTQSYRPPGWHGEWFLQVAHIASGQGKARRTDDRRSVALLAPLCHDLHCTDSDKFPSKWICGREWPTIDERHTLWLKNFYDSAFYDRDYLQTLWIGRVPEPQRPPEFWCKMLYENQGILI